jgi:guanylate kinase
MAFEGRLLIFSAPSGSGKTTIVRNLLKNNANLGFSISACTRDRRGRQEEHGKDYYFLSPQEFKEKIDNDEFVEWEEVYEGNFYGTLRSEIERVWASGKHVIFDVDVKGGLSLKKYYGYKALSIFVKVPNQAQLERQLRGRGTETEESISRRMFKLNFEMSFIDNFDAILVNRDLKRTLELSQEMMDEFLETGRLSDHIYE